LISSRARVCNSLQTCNSLHVARLHTLLYSSKLCRVRV